MGFMQERYHSIPVAVNGTYRSPSEGGYGGFLCTVSGTLTWTASDGLTVIGAFPVTAGVYTPMPFRRIAGQTIVLSAGAAGILGTV